MMPHTPGPWTRDKMRIVSGVKNIATVGFTLNSPLWPSPEEAEANMALILGAPVLAAAIDETDKEAKRNKASVTIPMAVWDALLLKVRGG
jgi:hypothetical protein